MSAMPPPPPPSAPPLPPPYYGGATPLQPGSVPNHLAWAIVSTVIAFCLCCVVGGIPGIVAIVQSSKVNKFLLQGDLAGAQQASKSARTWCWVTTGLAIFGLLLNVWAYSSGGMQQYQQMLEELQRAQGG